VSGLWRWVADRLLPAGAYTSCCRTDGYRREPSHLTARLDVDDMLSSDDDMLRDDE